MPNVKIFSQSNAEIRTQLAASAHSAIFAQSLSQPTNATTIGMDDTFSIARLIWPTLSETGFQAEQYQHYVTDLLRQAADIERRLSLREGAARSAIRTVVEGKTQSRHEIQTLLRQRYDQQRTGIPEVPQSSPLSESAILHLLELAARQWAMLDIKTEIPEYHPADTPSWPKTDTITSVVERHFTQKGRTADTAGSLPTPKIDPALTAARLITHHGVRIKWTSNLAEHLTLDQGVLWVFEHKIWAINHLRYPDSAPGIATDVLEELMYTLSLLFPLHDAPTPTLLERQGMILTFYGLGDYGRARSTDWARYRYWRAELRQLSALLEEAPHGLQQFWRAGPEQRNLLNLTLFWISGVMVAILTIVSSVCGVLSVKYSMEQRDLALAQLQVALVQVCADESAAARLPQYCG